jgi:hypothetical protein
MSSVIVEVLSVRLEILPWLVDILEGGIAVSRWRECNPQGALVKKEKARQSVI